MTLKRIIHVQFLLKIQLLKVTEGHSYNLFVKFKSHKATLKVDKNEMPLAYDEMMYYVYTLIGRHLGLVPGTCVFSISKLVHYHFYCRSTWKVILNSNQF